ncbi:MAG TPA: glutamate-5-semialdehyde dehydrogenase [Anaerolineales bacterium]|nr:glutamate-5-semialdehyde dehydrogenase [Anaerolineales bacterium]
MMNEMGKRARQAASWLASAASAQKDAALECMADTLLARQDAILEANQADLAAGERSGLSAALLDRLMLNPARLAGIVGDLRQLVRLPDPVGEIFEAGVLPNGLRIRKQRVPLGVLGVIYEARPNVTVDVAGLAIKTGNAAILRGGSETMNSNRELVSALRQALEDSGMPADVIQWVSDPDRARVLELLHLDESVDMIIPRGGAGLHDFCRRNSHIPVITGGIGICHLFVDASADVEKALPVIFNAKVQRPSVCNSLDTVLVHQSVAAEVLPKVVAHLRPAGVSFRAEPRAQASLQPLTAGEDSASVLPAGPEDFDTEWLSLVLGLKVVDDLEEAVAHIRQHSTSHSDGILTEDSTNARRFVEQVDSAVVYVNASTRFTDGAQLGLGAEVAVSTQRLHARGPMGLRELTTYKWVVEGDYHVRG